MNMCAYLYGKLELRKGFNINYFRSFRQWHFFVGFPVSLFKPNPGTFCAGRIWACETIMFRACKAVTESCMPNFRSFQIFTFFARLLKRLCSKNCINQPKRGIIHTMGLHDYMYIDDAWRCLYCFTLRFSTFSDTTSTLDVHCMYSCCVIG